MLLYQLHQGNTFVCQYFFIAERADVQYGMFIIEDGAYAFLAENAPSPLISLAPDLTIYVSGFAKNIAAGLRVGFIAAHEKYIPALMRAIRVTTWNTPSLMTSIICEWINDGTVAQLESEKCKDAQIRQRIAQEIFAGMHYISHPSSYFAWFPLPEEVRADQVAMALIQENISVSIAEPFAVSSSVPHAIRLAIGSVELDSLRTALRKVEMLLSNIGIYNCHCN
ncbi:aminotransferase class I/II-fold pyridoxal phosphate-dependent enzyme [Xenorhabdus sp. ZM]|nr:aminotransferase class I/II-fold pyridoxal phosphate-dependent enzyme [Xenorhabdus sp. ZM]